MRLLATPGAKEKWFDPILDGDVFFAGSTCSPEGQANYPEQADMFDFDEETQEWVINGEKAFCSGGTIADVLLISGLYKGTLHFAVMDPKNTPGLTCHHNPEFGNAPFYASYTCDNVRVPKDFGAKTNGGCVDRKAQHPAVVSRMFPVAVAAMNIGSAEAALEKTMDYLGVRTYNFKPIRNYGGVAERLVQLKIKLESARALMSTALNLIEAKDDKAIMYTAMAKGYCNDEPLMPRETYIGASGVAVKPELFIGVATSGQAQHTLGMYESGKVVVIDKNKDALFFNSCDYGIVGDYAEIVPAITKALEG